MGSLIKNVLVVDVGGTSVKILATGKDKLRKFPSDRKDAPACPAQGLTWQIIASGWHLTNDARRQGLIQALSKLDRRAAQLMPN